MDLNHIWLQAAEKRPQKQVREREREDAGQDDGGHVILNVFITRETSAQLHFLQPESGASKPIKSDLDQVQGAERGAER